MKARALFRSLCDQIHLNETEEEVKAIVYFLLRSKLGISKTQILADAEIQNMPDFSLSIQRINAHEPVQYVVGESGFYGRLFLVKPSVLIPRPETEQLVSLALKEVHAKSRVLDIGTGSGCIAVTLALESHCHVFGTDVSEPAIEVAKQNTERHKVNLDLVCHNILQQDIPFESLDIVVSNPPYVRMSEKKQMRKNVVEYEPHHALFVSDDHPLQFYEAIALKSFVALHSAGVVIVEINEAMGNECVRTFQSKGFSRVYVKKDINRKDRFVVARK